MNKENAVIELMDIDKKFCEECKENGADAWIKYFDEDGVMVSGKHNENIKGKEDIYILAKKLFNLEDLDFTWEPTYCDVSDDLTMGFTTGNYTRKHTYKGETVIEIGKYNTTWKKVLNEWKIVLDIGN